MLKCFYLTSTFYTLNFSEALLLHGFCKTGSIVPELKQTHPNYTKHYFGFPPLFIYRASIAYRQDRSYSEKYLTFIFLFMSISPIQYTLAKGDRTGPLAILLSTILLAFTMVPSIQLDLTEHLLTIRPNCLHILKTIAVTLQL